MPKIKIAPSILSADMSKINREIKEVEKYADLIHVDIMDGIFVPPTTVDAKFVKTIKAKVPLDVHLMVHEPSNSCIKGFFDAGANVFVAGTSIFGKKDRVAAIKEILRALK